MRSLGEGRARVERAQRGSSDHEARACPVWLLTPEWATCWRESGGDCTSPRGGVYKLRCGRFWCCKSHVLLWLLRVPDPQAPRAIPATMAKEEPTGVEVTHGEKQALQDLPPSTDGAAGRRKSVAVNVVENPLTVGFPLPSLITTVIPSSFRLCFCLFPGLGQQ